MLTLCFFVRHLAVRKIQIVVKNVYFLSQFMLVVLRCSAQAVKNGAISAHSAGHGDAGAAWGRQPWTPLLPTFLHLRCPWRRALWSNRSVNICEQAATWISWWLYIFILLYSIQKNTNNAKIRNLSNHKLSLFLWLHSLWLCKLRPTPKLWSQVTFCMK